MVESTRQQSRDPFDRFDDAINDPRLYESYHYPRAALPEPAPLPHGAIEEGALTAFNIALEQFHNAVADRKALLVSLPQNLQRAGTQLRATGAL